MPKEYTLIDLRTGLVWGPYSTFNEARSRADNFTHWDIMRDDDETVLDWTENRIPAQRLLHRGGRANTNGQPIIVWALEASL